MELNLFRRRTIWWPTWQGWLLLLAVFVAPVVVWACVGEQFLGQTRRIPADTLVIESWIQDDGFHAAAAEYRSGGYRHLVVTGGLTGSKGGSHRRSYSEIAKRELVLAGIVREAIIAAQTPDVEIHRTYTMAVAVRNELQLRGIRPRGINVFTESVHARRSRMVYEKVFGSEVKVGAIGWASWEQTEGESWWTSSERAVDLFKETLAYPYEALLSSGRRAD